MRFGRISWLAAVVALATPASASAYFVHTVAPSETLTSVAAADGLSVTALAAANGLSPSAELYSGQPLQIPPQEDLSGASAGEQAIASPGASSGTVNDTGGDAQDPGGYVVQPGDTLSAIAASDGTTIDALAALNGLDPNGILQSGAALQVPGESTAAADASASETTSGTATAEAQPVGASAEGTTGGPPYATDESVSGSEIADIAQANGVSPALAEAIGWQESGFNNDEISDDDAVGVMQILPGTWNWIQGTLSTGAPLDPASAADNVRGGVLLLRSLLDATGGDAAEAAAGYDQGLSSVQQNGMYADTQQYVNDVMALDQQFGGG
ncbi:MAG: LysM peptidoglycan-binding domain-containing protein [Solirubrobacteraceae bacterium]